MAYENDVLTRNENDELAVRTVQTTGDNPASSYDDVFTRDNNGKLAVRVVGSGGGDSHNKGSFLTPAALREAYPTAEPGDFAIVESTDTIWVWDSDGSDWKDADQKGQVTSVNGQTGDVVIPDELPSQTGHSGEFLTTDGTDASWASVDALPDQTGQSGKFLTTDGSSASWSNKPLVNLATGAGAVAAGLSSEASSYSAVSYGAYARSRARYSICLGSGYASAEWSIVCGITSEVSQSATGAIQLGYGTNSDASTFKVGLVTSTSPFASGNYELLSSDGTIPEARLADTTNAVQGQVLALDSNLDAVWTTPSGGGLPSQTGNSGKFLTTDGTDASWGDALTDTGTKGTNLNGYAIFGQCKARDSSLAIGASANINTVGGGYNLAVGNNATVGGGSYNVAIGSSTNIGSNSSGANTLLGYSARSSSRYNIAIGSYANNNGGGQQEKSIAIGFGANVKATGAIQIGVFNHVNSDANTFKVGNNNGNYEMMSADGTIPHARLTNAVQSASVTIATTDWSSNTASVTVSGLTATSVVWVAPDNASQSAYTTAGVYASSQSADTLVFNCVTTPTSALTINVAWC